MKLAGKPAWASSRLITTLSSLPPVGEFGNCEIFEVPTVEELGYEDTGQVLTYNTTQIFSFLGDFIGKKKNCTQDELTPFRGGESEALKRLKDSISDKV